MPDVLTCVIAFTLYSIFHSFMAGLHMKQWVFNHFPDIFPVYRIIFVVIQFVLFIVLWMFIPKPAQLLWQVDGFFEMVFRLIQILAIAGLVYSFRWFSIWEFAGLNQVRRYLSRRDRDSELLKNGHSLLTADERPQLQIRGLYAVSRHPIYLFTILLVAFEPRMILFKFLLLIWLIVYFYIGSELEERRLIYEFGEEYKIYKSRVSRILPFKWLAGIFRERRIINNQ